MAKAEFLFHNKTFPSRKEGEQTHALASRLSPPFLHSRPSCIRFSVFPSFAAENRAKTAIFALVQYKSHILILQSLTLVPSFSSFLTTTSSGSWPWTQTAVCSSSIAFALKPVLQFRHLSPIPVICNKTESGRNVCFFNSLGFPPYLHPTTLVFFNIGRILELRLFSPLLCDDDIRMINWGLEVGIASMFLT